MWRFAIIAAPALAGYTSGSAEVPPPLAPVRTVETIRYEYGPSRGSSFPWFVVTVSSDGKGTFEGISMEGLGVHPAVLGPRTISLTREQFEAFAAKLAPYRPTGELRIGGDGCNGRVATDQDGVIVTWTGKGPRSHLDVYLGCDPEHRAQMFKALREAPSLLPVTDLIWDPVEVTPSTH